MRRFGFAVLLLLAAAEAGARLPDARLDIVRTPNNGVPAIVAPGGTFEVDLQRRAEVRLVASDGTAYPLETKDVVSSSGSLRATCTAPKSVPPGTYAIEAVEGGRAVDRNKRAVYLRQSMPAAYVIAHIAMPRVGADGADASLRTALSAVNDALKAGPLKLDGAGDAEPAFVLITGDLTQDGLPDQYQALLSLLDACDLPTFVCPGGGDRSASDFFGGDAYTFTFGEDGYIAFRMRDSIGGNDGGAQAGRLQVFRRWIKPCRWSIGVSDRYDLEMDLRSQIVLFVDDPMHYVVAGVENVEENAPAPIIPWGHTRLVLTPYRPGAVRPLIVSDKGVKGLSPIDAGRPAK